MNLGEPRTRPGQGSRDEPLPLGSRASPEPAQSCSPAWADELRTVTIGTTTLAYRERGSGPPVVFVHGSLSDLRSWDEQVPAIGARYRAIAYSRRYARPNVDIDPGHDDPMLQHVDDLVEFLARVDAGPAHLVGNSFGACVCLLTAMRHPRLVRSMVLQEPPVLRLFVSMPPRPMELLRLFLSRPRIALTILAFGAKTASVAERALRRGDDEAAMRAFVHGLLGKGSYQRLPEARKQQARDNLSTLRAQILGAGFPALPDEEVRAVQVPTLLMTGARSPAYLVRLTGRLRELLPNVEQVEIAGASHAMGEEQPRAVNNAILAFLDRHGSH